MYSKLNIQLRRFVHILSKKIKTLKSVTGKTTTSKINGLALYNNGDKPINFNSGNIAALTATFTK